MTKTECFERLELILQKSLPSKYCKLEMVCSLWIKDDKNRTYFSLIEKSYNSKTFKHFVKYDYGYFDNVSCLYYPGERDLNANYTFGGIPF